MIVQSAGTASTRIVLFSAGSLIRIRSIFHDLASSPYSSWRIFHSRTISVRQESQRGISLSLSVAGFPQRSHFIGRYHLSSEEAFELMEYFPAMLMQVDIHLRYT